MTLAVWGLPWKWRQYVSPKPGSSYYTTRCPLPEDIIMNVHRTDSITSTAGCFTAVGLRCCELYWPCVPIGTVQHCSLVSPCRTLSNKSERCRTHFPFHSSKCTVRACVRGCVSVRARACVWVCVCVSVRMCEYQCVCAGANLKTESRRTTNWSGTLPDTIHTHTHIYIRHPISGLDRPSGLVGWGSQTPRQSAHKIFMCVIPVVCVPNKEGGVVKQHN